MVYYHIVTTIRSIPEGLHVGRKTGAEEQDTLAAP